MPALALGGYFLYGPLLQSLIVLITFFTSLFADNKEDFGICSESELLAFGR